MHFNLIVIGSGLAGLSFIDSYLEKNKKIDVISPQFKKYQYNNKSENLHLYNDKNLPPQMKHSQNNIKDYFSMNNFIVNKNSNIMGSLEFGGLSNYWGLQIDKNILSDTKCLSKKNNKKLQKSFVEIAKKAKFIGEFTTKSEKFKNDFNVDNVFSNLLKIKNISGLKITKPILAISGSKLKKENKINLNLIKEKMNKITAKNYYNKFLKRKNIHFHNYVVKKIFIHKKKIALVCKNRNKEKIFYTKKVVFACGTLVTTKLIMNFLKIKKEIKIKEHPRLISLFFSKRKIKNYLNFMPSQMQIRNDIKFKSFLMDFRPGNKFIIDTAIKIYKFLRPFETLLNYFKNYMIFSNILLDSKYSNLFIRLKDNSKAFIYSKNKEIKPIFKSIHKKVFKFLYDKKLIYPIYKNFFSGDGSAYHYFGTIPISNKKDKMSVNNFCQLKKFSNIYIVDGSVFDFKINKYPLGLIMANARRVAKEIKK